MGTYYCGLCEKSHSDVKKNVKCPNCGRYYCLDSIKQAKAAGLTGCPFCDEPLKILLQSISDPSKTVSIGDDLPEKLEDIILEVISVYKSPRIPLMRLVQKSKTDIEIIQEALEKMILEGRIQGRIEDKDTFYAEDDILVLDKNSNLLSKLKEQISWVDREESDQSLKEIEGLLSLARTAEEGQNHFEAYSYFSKVLEIDPKNVKAWIGKGKSAGWQSTLAAPRIEEAIVCFKKALEVNVDINDRVLIVESLNELVHANFNLAYEHYQEFEQNSTQYSTGLLDWIESRAEDADYNAQLRAELLGHATALIKALEYTWEISPDIETARILIYICQILIKGKIAREDATVTRINEIMANYETKARNIDPEFQFQLPQEPSGCFIITATMGSHYHPHIHELRKFRDEILLENHVGRYFVTKYYQWSPRWAKIISRSRFLRYLSRLFIVFPAVNLSRGTRRRIHNKKDGFFNR